MTSGRSSLIQKTGVAMPASPQLMDVCVRLHKMAFVTACVLLFIPYQGYSTHGAHLRVPNHRAIADSRLDTLSRNTIPHPCTGSKHTPALNTTMEGHLGMTSALILLYTWNFDLFMTSLQSYVASGMGSRTIIIDNSEDGRVFNDMRIRCMVGKVLATKAPLTFSQLQNFMGQVALDNQLTFYFWGHSDVAVLPSNATSSFSKDVLGCIADWMTARPDWGVIFFSYDLFAAFRTEMVAEVKWDTFIAHYGSDCDYYATSQSHGWHIANHNEFCPEVRVKVFDLKRPLDIPYHNYNKALKMLLDEKHADIDRNNWKESVWKQREKVGHHLWEEASHKYYKAKWGDVGCDGIGVIGEDGTYHLHKDPFQDTKPTRSLLSSLRGRK